MAIPKLENYAVSEDAMNLKNLLDKTLETVVNVFAAHGVPLPTRQYWTVSQPAWDCAQVVVSFIQAYLGLPGGDASQPLNCNSPRSAVLQVSIIREVPTVGAGGKAPSGAAIQAASEWPAVDAWVLLESLEQFDNWDPMGGKGPGLIATVSSEQAQGGFLGTTLQLTVAIP